MRKLTACAASLILACLVSGLGHAAAPPPPPPPDLSGTWAQLLDLTEATDLALIGRVTTTTTFAEIITIEQGTDHKLRIREKICASSMKSSSKELQTILPKGFFRSLPGARRLGELVYKKDRWEYRVHRAPSILGAKLKRPAKDALPVDARDPRVIDQDRDGKPGVTVRIRGTVTGEVQIVQRAFTRLRGLPQGKDRVEGIVRWSREQKVLGATNPLLRSPPQARPHPDMSRSRFRMRRVAKGTDCAKLAKIVNTLFAGK